MEWVKLILSNLTGIAAIIALFISMIKYADRAVKEKNWTKIVKMVSGYMERAESMFDNGADRKEWVMAMTQVSAETTNYDVNMSEISKLIDDLCAMSKKVNVQTETGKVGG